MRAARNARLYSIGALACLTAVIYWPSTIFLYKRWSAAVSDTDTYSHGWLILLICIGLVVRARRDLAAAPVRPSPLAAVALAVAIVMWLVTYHASIEGLQVPLQPLIFWLAVSTAFGAAVGRVLLFPVAYLYFAEPVWYGTQLQYLTVLVTRGLLAVTGPTASIVGDVIRLPNGTFVIEEGCSGLHFMIVGLAVAALYGEQQRDSWPVRFRQLALMAGLALLANWVRVYTVIEAGYLTDMQSYLVRVSHYGFGWCVFAVALLVFFWLAPRLAPKEASQPAAAAAATATATATATAAPALLSDPQALVSDPPRRAELGGVALAMVILIALPLLNLAVRASRPAPPLEHPAALAPQLPWRAVPVDVRSAWLPIFPGADELQRRAFGNTGGATVEVLGVAYRTQRQDEELVGESSSLTGKGLRARAERLVGSTAGQFRETEVTDRTDGRSLIWSRYQVNGRNLVHPLTQQLWFGINALVWQPPSGLIALRTPCDADCGSAGRTLQDFVAHSGMR